MRAARVLFIYFFILLSHQGSAYSVFTHQELVDLAWNDSIKPLLLARYPQTTSDELREAHAFAYGGAAIQDMGYYPFGANFFSDLTHYVRSGDLIAWYLSNARNVYEYAFAIGALSHYFGDSLGHSLAINPATAVAFPTLEQKYGDSVTYDESPHSHIRTEFAFDIGELSNKEFAPPEYLKFIGLEVPRNFLERGFAAIYGFDLHELVGVRRVRPALRSYKTSVRKFLPAFAEAEVVLHHKAFPPAADDEAHRIFAERMERTNYERHWKRSRSGPGIRAHLLAAFVFIVPKIGPASDLAIKIPTPETQHLYLSSVNRTVDVFRETLHQLGRDGPRPVSLTNIDLDTGNRIKPGDYALTDKTYARLLNKLVSRPDRSIPASLKRNITRFYGGAAASKLDAQQSAQLAILKTMKVAETQFLWDMNDMDDDDKD